MSRSPRPRTPGAASRRAAPARGPERDQAILEATIRLLGRGGLAAVTHRAVAREAGVSLGVVTYRHPTIEALLDTAFRMLCVVEQRELALLTDRLSSDPFDGASWARAFAEALAQRIEAGREDLAGFELMLGAARLAPLRKPMRDTGRAYEALAARALREAGARDPDALAPLLTAAITGLQLHQLADPRPRYVERLADALRTLVEGMVAAEKAVVSRRGGHDA